MPLTEHNARYIPVEKYKAKLLANRRIEGECWLWTGGRSRKRTRGAIKIVELGRLIIEVHRLSLFLFKPEEFKYDLFVNHKCSNSLCFNPDHIYAGTRYDNIEDMVRAKTKCMYGHILENNTYTDKNGNRGCRICRIEASERWRNR